MKNTVLSLFIIVSASLNAQELILDWGSPFKKPLNGGTAHAQEYVLDQSKNSYCTGTFRGAIDFDPSSDTYILTNEDDNDYDIFLVKLDVNGQLVWALQFDSFDVTIVDGWYSTIISLALDADENIILASLFGGPFDVDPGPEEYIIDSGEFPNPSVVKFDPDGNLLWVSQIDTEGDGSGMYNMIVDQMNHIVLSGFFADSADFNPDSEVFNITASNYRETFIWELDENGNFVDAMAYGGSNIDILHIIENANGDVHFIGTYSGNPDFDPSDAVFNVPPEPFTYNFFLSKFDNTGTFLWSKTIMSHDLSGIANVQIDQNGDFLFAGSFSDSLSMQSDTLLLVENGFPSFSDIFLSKYSAEGDFMWVQRFGSDYNYDWVYDLKLDDQDNIFITGFFAGTIDLDKGPSSYYLESFESSEDIFIGKFDSDAQLIYAYAFGAEYFDTGYRVEVDNVGGLYMYAQYWGYVDFDPNLGEYIIQTSAVSSAPCVVKFSEVANSIVPFDEKIPYSAYPNPSLGKFVVQSSDVNESVELEVQNCMGELVLTKRIVRMNEPIDLSELESGIYYLKFTNRKNELNFLRIVLNH
jgi:hypothetical protein